MPIIQVIIVLAVIGLVLALFNLIPLDATIKRAFNIIVIGLTVLWLIIYVLLPLAGLGGKRLG